jgi:hypothetical protein
LLIDFNYRHRFSDQFFLVQSNQNRAHTRTLSSSRKRFVAKDSPKLPTLTRMLLLAVACLSGTSAVKIGGGPKRVDQLTIDSGSDSLLTALEGITILDTGLVIQANVCDLPSAVTRLTTSFASLKEVRGWLFITKGSCMSDLSFLGKLAVVRADMVAADAPGITLIGFAPTDMLVSLSVSIVLICVSSTFNHNDAFGLVHAPNKYKLVHHSGVFFDRLVTSI